MDSATLTINVVDDLTPVAGQVSAKVDDDGLAGSNPLSGANDIDANAGEVGAGTASEAVWTGTLAGTGGDAPTVFLFQESLEAVNTDTLGTETLQYVVSADGLTLQAFVDGGARDGTLLFDIVINNASTGAYTLTLRDNVLHAPGGNDETSDTLTIPYQMRDVDNDLSVSPGSINIEFNDDTPANNAGTVAITVHEDALNNADAVGNNEGGKTVTASITVAQLQALVSPGADSPVTIGLNPLIDGAATGLTQNGVSIVWDFVSATQVRGLVNNNPADVAFTLTFDAVNGEYDFVLLDNIDNNNDGNLLTGEGDADTDSLSLANVFTATDADGDQIVIDAGASVNIENDVPINNAGTVSVTVHEDALNNADAVGNNEGGKTVTASITVAQLQALVSPGADAPVTIGLNAAIDGAATGLTQNGVSIVWDFVSATQVRGLVNNNPADVAFTLTFDAVNNEYDFVLLDNIDNNNDGQPADRRRRRGHRQPQPGQRVHRSRH